MPPSPRRVSRVYPPTVSPAGGCWGTSSRDESTCASPGFRTGRRGRAVRCTSTCLTLSGALRPRRSARRDLRSGRSSRGLEYQSRLISSIADSPFPGPGGSRAHPTRRPPRSRHPRPAHRRARRPADARAHRRAHLPRPARGGVGRDHRPGADPALDRRRGHRRPAARREVPDRGQRRRRDPRVRAARTLALDHLGVRRHHAGWTPPWWRSATAPCSALEHTAPVPPEHVGAVRAGRGRHRLGDDADGPGRAPRRAGRRPGRAAGLAGGARGPARTSWSS